MGPLIILLNFRCSHRIDFTMAFSFMECCSRLNFSSKYYWNFWNAFPCPVFRINKFWSSLMDHLKTLAKLDYHLVDYNFIWILMITSLQILTKKISLNKISNLIFQHIIDNVNHKLSILSFWYIRQKSSISR